MRFLFPVILCVVVAVGVIFALHFRNTMPATMPDDLTINYTKSNGEEPTNKAYTLMVGQSTANIAEGMGDGETYNFSVTHDEMQTLYTMLRAQRLSTIHTKESYRLHDASSINLTVTWSDQKIVLENGTTIRVVKSASDRFFMITSALNAFVQMKMRNEF